MPKRIDITGKNALVTALSLYAETVQTEEGNIYYRIPFWFEVHSDMTFSVHIDEPEDLAMFICKSGLGGDNPKIKEPKL